MVRFIRSTCPLVQGCLGLVRRWSILLRAQATSKAGAQNGSPRSSMVQLGEGELRGPIDGDEEVEPALGGADFGDVDVEVADRIGLELTLYALAVLDIRKP